MLAASPMQVRRELRLRGVALVAVRRAEAIALSPSDSAGWVLYRSRLACAAMRQVGPVRPLTREEFADCLLDLGAVVDLNADLPDRPFLDPDGYVAVADFDWIFDCAPVLESLCARHGDDEIVVLDAAQANEGSADIHPGFRISADALFDEFSDAVHSQRDPESPWTFYMLADVVVITGSSKRWTIWGSRGWELMLVHDSAGPGRWLHVGLPFLRPSEGLPRYLRGVSPTTVSTFRTNFPDLHDGQDPAAHRPLTDAEAAIVDFLLAADFPGVTELRVQRQQLLVHGLWRDLPGAVIFDRSDRYAPRTYEASGTPVHARVKGSDLEVVLFAAMGVLDCITVMDQAGNPQSFLPAIEDLDAPSVDSDRPRAQSHRPWPPPASSRSPETGQ